MFPTITNSLIKLNEEYSITLPARSLAMHVLRRIWLRLGIEDITNVNDFLDRQLQFVKNRMFDIHSIEKISSFNGYEIFMKSEVNPTWDETTRSMIFTIQRNDSVYELPRILFDIDDNGVCYIYAVQNSIKKKDKIIERQLYILNKNIEDPNVHPSKVCAMMLFIEELKKKGISKIKIPSMQVLSYRFHELISEQAKKSVRGSKNIIRKIS